LENAKLKLKLQKVLNENKLDQGKDAVWKATIVLTYMDEAFITVKSYD
jgi:hypothetical protein